MKSIREEQFYFIQRVKNFLAPAKQETKQEITLEDIVRRIEKLESMIQKESENESVRKAKIKDQIISLLEQHKRLTSSQLSKLINLSRTRCNEYFRELTAEGITEGVLVDRKKYYKLVKK
ncbi:MAG: winged helix-turn-helix domain-containing protein [Candidatus Aenigmatarchaeota archaeon]